MGNFRFVCDKATPNVFRFLDPFLLEILLKKTARYITLNYGSLR
jgi:predicted protein tyrosine phosphatase